MNFLQLNDGPCKTYLISDHGLAMFVDPVLEEVEHYIGTLRQKGLELKYIVDTHVHADHISGAAALRDRTGAHYVMHENSGCVCADYRVSGGDRIELGATSIEIRDTPGHTKDSISLIFPDRILTGDFLFIGEGGAGRTDLPGGDAGEHWDSLATLADLSGTLLVFPAHDYHGRTQSTLAAERRNNPRLQPRSREDYIQWLDNLRLGATDWMADVVKANYACARDPQAVWIPMDAPTCEVSGTRGNINDEKVRTISAETLSVDISSDNPPFLLDVRQPEEFTGALGHIPGSELIPIAELPHALERLSEKRDTPIVTVCHSGARSMTAAAILTVAGFSDVRSLEGGIVSWLEHGEQSSEDAVGIDSPMHV